ncbi:MAG: cytochrome c maturation protein CcmE [Anaerolineae bacterium]|nr:cytochrome c maturation protein CcmE [Anaerolineae bacterium]
MSINEDIPVRSPNRSKYLVAGFLILAAVVYLIVSSTAAGAQYFLTVDELMERRDSLLDKPVRITGAVIGDTVDWNAEELTLRFTVVHIPADDEILNIDGGLAAVLHDAVNNDSLTHLEVVYYGVRPDLLQHESQAILSGRLGADGIFYADELLLKCPTKYEEALPGQAET